MASTIVFILNKITDSHCHRRIEEFIKNGYKVKVYGFARKGLATSYTSQKYECTLLDTISDKHYAERIGAIYGGIIRVNTEINKNDILYLFGLDIAIINFIQPNHHRYIFEEADLTHTYVRNKYIKKSLEIVDKYIIKKSVATVTTSEGFIKYHFNNKIPHNIFLVCNKLNPEITLLRKLNKKRCTIGSLHFAFVGAGRYKSIANFGKCIGKRFPQHTFHIFGSILPKELERFAPLKSYNNIIFHGEFSNPTDLPFIYSQIDICVATYDTDIDNVRYAEPNKLYECLYFNTPLVVSNGTFLAEKVKRLNMGFAVDATNDDNIINFISGLTEEKIQAKKESIEQYPKEQCINENEYFFRKLGNIIER